MKADMVETIEGCLDDLVLACAIHDCAICMCAVELSFALVVATITMIDSFGVALDGEVSIYHWVLGSEVRFVEVVSVSNVGAAETRFECQWCIRTDKHGNTASSTCWASVTFLIQRNITCHDDCIAAIPGGGLDPID